MSMVWILQCEGSEFRIEIADGVMIPTFNGKPMYREAALALAGCMAHTAEKMVNAREVNVKQGGEPS